ncbi:MAG: type IIA DNA topoisomerase subunit B, partial [Muribaculaceae bacterium]|nr:type IIA DNA topoisomerase subunit B [Muribaculaceae bacterium]
MQADAEPTGTAGYSEEDIQTLDWKEHIQRRPGMYIGKLGDGTNSDDGIYVLLKEVLDNSIDEYMMGFGRQIVVNVDEASASVRDYGRGIPLGSLVAVASKMNTGAKYDSAAFKKSVGLNGVGIKAVNALSTTFEITAYRDGKCKHAVFNMGNIVEESDIVDTDEPNGTLVSFTPSAGIFRDYKFRDEFIVPLLKNYTFLNTGLAIIFNGHRYISRHGLLDLLKENMTQDAPLYPIIHLKGADIEVAITHVNQYGEEYYSFVNGQHTTQGGTHLSAFKEAVARTLKDYFNRNFEFSDIRNGMVAAIAIKVEEPLFESQTKTKLGSLKMSPDGVSVAKYVGDFIRKELDNYLHREKDVAEVILKKVQESERDRKAMAGVAKKARETAKKVSLYNRKLNDCRVHLSDTRGNDEKKEASSIFITEGDSAGGSIEKVRDVETQAVFKLRGGRLYTTDA